MREHADGDFPFAADFDALARSLPTGTFVRSGCTLDDGGSEDMTLDVASGTAEVDWAEVPVAAQSVTVSEADEFDRYDLVVVDDAGEVRTVTGTTEQVAPSIPDGTALLGIVEVGANVTGVTDADVHDARIVFERLNLRHEEKTFHVHQKLATR